MHEKRLRTAPKPTSTLASPPTVEVVVATLPAAVAAAPTAAVDDDARATGDAVGSTSIWSAFRFEALRCLSNAFAQQHAKNIYDRLEPTATQ